MLAVGTPITPPRYPIQLIDVYLYEAELRRGPREVAFVGPTLETQVIGDESDAGTTNEFIVRLAAKIEAPFGEDALASIHVDVLGVFRSADALDADARQEFAMTQALLLLWPYLRANVGELVRMTSLEIPLLPTLDVLDTLRMLDQDASASEPGVAAARPKRLRKPKGAAAKP